MSSASLFWWSSSSHQIIPNGRQVWLLMVSQAVLYFSQTVLLFQRECFCAKGVCLNFRMIQKRRVPFSNFKSFRTTHPLNEICSRDFPVNEFEVQDKRKKRKSLENTRVRGSRTNHFKLQRGCCRNEHFCEDASCRM